MANARHVQDATNYGNGLAAAGQGISSRAGQARLALIETAVPKPTAKEFCSCTK
jgi:hypothetical protein